MANLLNERKNLLSSRQKSDLSLAVKPQADLTLSVNLHYDYTLVEPAHREAVMAAAVDIRTRGDRVKRDIVAIGKGLAEVKDRLPHGQFTEWCRAEFELSDRMARNYMGVYEAFKDRPATVALLSDSILMMLAAPSITERAITAVEAEAATTGKSPSKTRTAQIIAENTAKRGRPAKHPITIDSSATVGKGRQAPESSAQRSAANSEERSQLVAHLQSMNAAALEYERITGDASSAQALRTILGKMLENLA